MELCPKCDTALRITASKYIMRQGEVYFVQEFTCRNPQCENNGQVVDKIEHHIEVEKE